MSSYDDIKGLGSSPEVHQRFFESYIAPLLKDSSEVSNPKYFFNKGWQAWTLGVTQNDSKNVKFIEFLCSELYRDEKQIFLETIAEILKAKYDVGVRSEQGERNLHNSRVRGEAEQIYSDQLRLYKILFENEFKLDSTIPYLYLCKKFGVDTAARTAQEFVNVGASTKFHAIKNATVTLPQGSFADLFVGFDNKIRNAGEGHDQWKVLDNGNVELNVTDPDSGKTKSTITFTQKELSDLVKVCRKTLWVLTLGYLIYLENNKNLLKEVAAKKEYTRREIEEYTKEFAADRAFELKKLNITEDRTKVELSIQYAPQITGTNGSIFFGTAEAYDVVYRRLKVKYEFQMLDIIKYLLMHFDSEQLPQVKVQMFGDKGVDYGLAVYEKKELKKVLKEEGEHLIPKPSAGTIPQVICQIAVPMRVAYGTGTLIQKTIDKLESEEKN